ncbi:MAG: YrzE family protein [Methanobacterium sp.]|nr:YrzE family protein [Methanobacterium sp.]
MSYLICDECAKQHPLPEGEKSFNFERCSCGGRLRYSTTKRDYSPKRDYNQKIITPNREYPPYHGNTTTKKNPHSKSDYSTSQKSYTPLSRDKADMKTNTGGVKWKGVLVGLLFLFVSLIISVAIVFGENVPTDPSSIPVQLLSYLSILTIILTILAGSVSAYLSGSKKYLEGAINGGMVGIILGLILGLVGGLMVFLSGTLVFGLLSMAGGIIGIFPRKLFKK